MRNTPITHFETFGLSPELMQALTKMNFQTPSPVQEATIAPMLAGRDVLVQAPTGTGKTAAFGIPIVERVDITSRHIQTIILSPTRELALQITSVLQQLTAFKHSIRVQALYGGEPIYRQINALKRRPQIVVATPGRLMDHMKRNTVRLKHVNCIVLDEADRMLDMGFRDDIAAILQQLPTERQTVLFSATVSPEIKNIAATYQTEAEQICIQQETLTVDSVAQYYADIRHGDKTPALLHLLDDQNFKLCLVFVATKIMAENLARELSLAGHPADALHGDLEQPQRNRVMQRYRKGEISLLVATDVAARGIDVDGIDAVINYDIPGDSDSYVHRIGRTGRADKSGVAYTFVGLKERGKLQNIIKSTKATITPVTGMFGRFGVQEVPGSGGSGSRSGTQSGKKPARRRNNGGKPWNKRRSKPQ
ncbi:MAG: DEAD/DEAH box helicase [Oscillospiraceae bacterium]|nr:DEAD/DEAH box helicase [Oscillospiraceae bacterium]